jgi:hypothetical protein
MLTCSPSDIYRVWRFPSLIFLLSLIKPFHPQPLLNPWVSPARGFPFPSLGGGTTFIRLWAPKHLLFHSLPSLLISESLQRTLSTFVLSFRLFSRWLPFCCFFCPPHRATILSTLDLNGPCCVHGALSFRPAVHPLNLRVHSSFLSTLDLNGPCCVHSALSFRPAVHQLSLCAPPLATAMRSFSAPC